MENAIKEKRKLKKDFDLNDDCDYDEVDTGRSHGGGCPISGRTKGAITVMVFVGLVAFTIVDFYKGNFFLFDSARFTANFQHSVDSVRFLVIVVCKIFSIPLTYWIFPYLIF